MQFVAYIKKADVAARNFAVVKIAPFPGSEGVISGLEDGREYDFIATGMRWNWIIYGPVWGNWSNWVSATPGETAASPVEP